MGTTSAVFTGSSQFSADFQNSIKRAVEFVWRVAMSVNQSG